MSAHARIIREQGVRGGAPTIDGTRITVTDIAREYWLALCELAAHRTGPPDPQVGWCIPLDRTSSAIVPSRACECSQE